MRLRRWTAAVATAIAMGAVGGPAAVAQAGEVHVEAVVSPSSEGQYVAFTAAPGERNRVTVRYRAANTVRVQDTAGVVAGEGCTAESPNVVCIVRGNEFGDQWSSATWTTG